MDTTSERKRKEEKEKWLKIIAKQLIYNFLDMRKGMCSKELMLIGLVTNLSKLGEDDLNSLKIYVHSDCEEKIFVSLVDEAIVFTLKSRVILN